MSTTTNKTGCLVSEIAQRIDVSPGDVIEAAIQAGIEQFWIEGENFGLSDPAAKAMFFKLFRLHTSIYAVEFDATEEQAEELARCLGVEPEEVTGVRS